MQSRWQVWLRSGRAVALHSPWSVHADAGDSTYGYEKCAATVET